MYTYEVIRACVSVVASSESCIYEYTFLHLLIHTYMLSIHSDGRSVHRCPPVVFYRGQLWQFPCLAPNHI